MGIVVWTAQKIHPRQRSQWTVKSLLRYHGPPTYFRAQRIACGRTHTFDIWTQKRDKHIICQCVPSSIGWAGLRDRMEIWDRKFGASDRVLVVFGSFWQNVTCCIAVACSLVAESLCFARMDANPGGFWKKFERNSKQITVRTKLFCASVGVLARAYVQFRGWNLQFKTQFEDPISRVPDGFLNDCYRDRRRHSKYFDRTNAKWFCVSIGMFSACFRAVLGMKYAI